MIIAISLTLAGWLVTGIIFGLWSSWVTFKKLRSEHYFWLGFFFLFFGVIIAYLITDYRQYVKAAGLSLSFHIDQKGNKAIYFSKGEETISQKRARRIIADWVFYNQDEILNYESNKFYTGMNVSYKCDNLERINKLLNDKIISKEEHDNLKKELMGN